MRLEAGICFPNTMAELRQNFVVIPVMNTYKLYLKVGAGASNGREKGKQHEQWNARSKLRASVMYKIEQWTSMFVIFVSA